MRRSRLSVTRPAWSEIKRETCAGLARTAAAAVRPRSRASFLQTPPITCKVVGAAVREKGAANDWSDRVAALATPSAQLARHRAGMPWRALLHQPPTMVIGSASLFLCLSALAGSGSYRATSDLIQVNNRNKLVRRIPHLAALYILSRTALVCCALPPFRAPELVSIAVISLAR
jgi:hypothetical protein